MLIWNICTMHWKNSILSVKVIKDIFSIVKQIDLPIPNLNEQEYISTFFTNIDEKINFTKMEIEKTKEFLKGLLQQNVYLIGVVRSIQILFISASIFN